MSFAKCLVLALSVVASVNGLTTPHAARHALHHRSVAARVAEPRSENTIVNAFPRAPAPGRKRCKTRPASSTVSRSSTASSTPTGDILPPINAAPIPSSSTVAPPKPSTTPKPSSTAAPPAPPKTTSKPATPTPPPSSGGGGGSGGVPGGFYAGVNSGDGTFYDTGLGSCGFTNQDSDYIVAVSHILYDSYPGYNRVNPNNNPICNKQIRATRGGKSVTVKVVDRCGGCSATSLDFSPVAFNQLGSPGEGRIPIQWSWV